MTEFGNKGSSPGFLRKPRGEAFTTLMPRENETETAREFDAENKTLAITERAAGRRSPLSELDYTYDEAGNRTATVTTDYGTTDHKTTLDTYHYDETYQVTGADYAAPVTGIVPPGATATVGAPAATVRYTYDAVGNRVQVDENGAVTRYADNSLNQYTQVGEFAPTHDRNGNLSGMGQWLYRYDAMNRLVFASNGVTTANFYYDAKNRCVARSYTTSGAAVAPSTSTFTLNYYDNWNLIDERDGAGTQQARYVHGRRIDEIIVMVNKHGTFYPHHDVLGNVTMLTDRAGRLVERYTYSVTGQVAINDASGKTLTESAVGNRWMFTGREWLQEVGLFDYRNRVYSAELGRFLQTDPIRFSAGDVNIYRYVSNNYPNSTDPFGLDEYAIGGVATASVVGGSTAGFGLVYNSSAATWMDSIGIYGSVGGVVGIDVGVGVQGTWISGTAGSFSGSSINVNVDATVVSASAVTNIEHGTDAIGKLPAALSDPSSGALVGGSVGLNLGLPAGASVSFNQTGVITLGDVFRAISGFFSWLGE